MKAQEGFSLVELMIVVGIIGILSALAIPKLTVFMAKARQAEAKSSLAAMTTLQRSYAIENNGTYPTGP
jgi:type IV pilus assembly protein PilA